MADTLQQRARQRWKILASVIKKQCTEKEDNKISVRRFAGFNLFSKKVVHIDNECETDYEWLDYRHGRETVKTAAIDQPLFIKQRCRKVVLEDLTGFDNTGNVCLWPSEEVLASYVLKHKDEFDRKAVCELGAGMTGLAGIFLASFGNPSKVLLTDGNQDCVENMEAIIYQNKPLLGSAEVSSERLLWDEHCDLSALESQFDFIITADCLFFTQCHSGLLHVMETLLKDNGSVIIMAPQRKDTLKLFCSKAASKFSVVEIENYDSVVWSRHQLAKKQDPMYDEDIHYPVLLLLLKKHNNSFS